MLGMPMVGRMFHIVRHVILLADGGRMLGVLRLGSMLHLAVRRRAVLGVSARAGSCEHTTEKAP